MKVALALPRNRSCSRFSPLNFVRRKRCSCRWVHPSYALLQGFPTSSRGADCTPFCRATRWTANREACHQNSVGVAAATADLGGVVLEENTA